MTAPISIADRLRQAPPIKAATRSSDFGADEMMEPHSAEPVKILASPFRWPDACSLPRRPWIFGRWLLRETVSAIVAPGGVGKSSFVASMLLALASGRQAVLGKTVWAGPKTVWYWNLEDGLAELEMQLTAASMFHRIGRSDCGERIYLDSGPEGQELCIAVEDRDGYRIATPIVEALVVELLARKIDVLVVDPFVSSHGVSENDNVAIDAVAKTWTRIAKLASCAIVLVHHSKKLGSDKVTAESSRGASALVSAARVTLVLNRMDLAEANKLGIAEDCERRRLFTVQDDKANRAPAEDAQWFRLASQDVGNSTGFDDPWGEHGDSVGVVVPWSPPDHFEGGRPCVAGSAITPAPRMSAAAAGWPAPSPHAGATAARAGCRAVGGPHDPPPANDRGRADRLPASRRHRDRTSRRTTQARRSWAVAEARCS